MKTQPAQPQPPKRKRPVGFILLFAGIALLILLLMLPLIWWLSQPNTQAEIQAWVANLGWLGVLVTLLLQMLQVVVSVIPGEPFELLAGVLYGGFGGLLICVTGCFFATLIAFHLSRRFGKPLLKKLFGEKQLQEYRFLQTPKRQETAVFILFLIPGIPKDILTYIAGTGPMKPLTFTIIATFARIPAIAASTFIGSNILSGNWVAVLLLFAAIAVLGLLGIHFRDRIIAFTQRLGQRKEEKNKNGAPPKQ